MNRQGIVVAAALLAAACASYDGRGLRPGVDGAREVRALMGPPDEIWQEADGGSTWSYPRGPLGRQAYMVQLGADGRLKSIRQVLNEETFARIINGKTTRDEVRRLLGRPAEERFLPRKRETVWDYRYLDLGQPYIFRIGFTEAGVVTDSVRIPEINDGDRDFR